MHNMHKSETLHAVSIVIVSHHDAMIAVASKIPILSETAYDESSHSYSDSVSGSYSIVIWCDCDGEVRTSKLELANFASFASKLQVIDGEHYATRSELDALSAI